jgi:hypothetical protein
MVHRLNHKPDDPWTAISIAVRRSLLTSIEAEADELGLTKSSWARMKLIEAIRAEEVAA